MLSEVVWDQCVGSYVTPIGINYVPGQYVLDIHFQVLPVGVCSSEGSGTIITVGESSELASVLDRWENQNRRNAKCQKRTRTDCSRKLASTPSVGQRRFGRLNEYSKFQGNGVQSEFPRDSWTEVQSPSTSASLGLCWTRYWTLTVYSLGLSLSMSKCLTEIPIHGRRRIGSVSRSSAFRVYLGRAVSNCGQYGARLHSGLVIQDGRSAGAV